MALVTSSTEHSETRGIVLSDPAQRARAIRAAQRNSWFVAYLRIAFPVLIVCLLSSYILFVQLSTKIEDDKNRGTFKVSSVDLLSAKPTMRNPSYTGFNKKDGTEYTIRADRAVTDLNENKPIDLFGIEADIRQKGGTTFKMTSKEGKFDRKNDKLELLEEIVITSSNEMSARLSSATILPKQGLIQSQQPVSMRLPAGTVEGNKLHIDQKKKHVNLRDGVSARLHPNANKNAETGTSQTGMATLTGHSDKPVDIKAQKLFVQTEKQFASFTGSVVVTQENIRLTSNIMDIEYKAENSVGGASSVKKITARENVVITRSGDRITTKLATFNTQKNIAEMTGSVVISSGEDRTITSDKAVFNSAENKALLTGQVIAKQGKNILQGTRLDFDHKRGTLSLTNPSQKNGRIKAQFSRQEEGGSSTKPAAAARSAPSANRGVAMMSNQTFQMGSDTPTHVEADRLDIDEGKGRATFRGDVRIKQDKFKICLLYTSDAADD